MNLPYILSPHLSRKSTLYPLSCSGAPASLFESEPVKPDFTDFPLPLPSKKSDYRCSAVTSDGALWAGASNGVTRCCLTEKKNTDKVMFFSFERDLPDNDVKNIAADGTSVWVLTAKGITHIELIMLSSEQRADILLKETLRIVDRHGMISQKNLKERGNTDSFFPYGHCDNDGGFTALFAWGEVFRYAVMKREKGIDAPETIDAKKTATRAIEAVLLLMHIHGRGNGFVSRSYLCPDEPIPDDGLFFRREGGKATCIETTYSKIKGMAGKVFDASAPIPERLAKLYKDEGYSGEGIVFKGDTSSDEITIEFVMLWLAHTLLGEDDKELDALIIESVKNTMNHIIDNNFRLVDATGESTTWARWYQEYFETEDGWDDAALNSAELLMLLNATMAITGEQGRWRETYDSLIAKGYADYGPLHFDRHTMANNTEKTDFVENIMYGDHMLATCAFYVLCRTEKDEGLLAKYRKAYSTWRYSIGREFSPAYDFPYLAACPDAGLDMDRIAVWFDRANISRLASSVSMRGRHDVPVKKFRNGYEGCGYVCPPDERYISKFDRDPLEYKDEDSGGAFCVETCAYYTLPYWMGRYYGFIAEEGTNE